MVHAAFQARLVWCQVEGAWCYVIGALLSLDIAYPKDSESLIHVLFSVVLRSIKLF